jgi:hypothetical protein
MIVLSTLLSPVAFANEAHDLMIGMPDWKRNLALTHIVKSVQEDCDVVVRNFYQGVYRSNGSEFWNVMCRNGKSYSIMMIDDATGTMYVASCELFAVPQFKTRPCFQKFSLTFSDLD